MNSRAILLVGLLTLCLAACSRGSKPPAQKTAGSAKAGETDARKGVDAPRTAEATKVVEPAKAIAEGKGAPTVRDEGTKEKQEKAKTGEDPGLGLLTDENFLPTALARRLSVSAGKVLDALGPINVKIGTSRDDWGANVETMAAKYKPKAVSTDSEEYDFGGFVLKVPGLKGKPTAVTIDGKQSRVISLLKESWGKPLVAREGASADRTQWKFPYRGVQGLCFSPAEDVVMTVWGFNEDEVLTASTWDIQNGKEAVGFRPPELCGMSSAFSPDGAQVVVGSQRLLADGKRLAAAWLLDSKNGRVVRKLDHDSSVHCVAFSGDGALVATGTFDGKVRVFNKDNGTALAVLEPKCHLIAKVQFAKDGRHLLVVASGLVLWYDWQKPQPERTWKHPMAVFSADISPDGSRVVTTCGGYEIPGPADKEKRGARVWDARSGELVWFKAFDYPYSAAFSADSQRIMISDQGKKVYVVGAANGQTEGVVETGGRYTRLTVSPSGKKVAMWEDLDGFALIWQYERLLAVAKGK